MIGDKITIRPEYFSIAEKIAEQIKKKNLIETSPQLVIGIAGESGSGKSVTALCLQQVLEQQNKKVVVLHQDDYFILPPKTNHAARQQNEKQIGPQEVNLILLQHHIHDFVNQASEITKPIVNYNENKIESQQLDISNADVLIIEGTYVLQLQQLNHKIFMARTYLDTVQQRKDRAREQHSDFIEHVLQIEHAIISNQKQKADMIVLKDYSLQTIL
jgi:uridine kinase